MMKAVKSPYARDYAQNKIKILEWLSDVDADRYGILRF